MSVAWTYADWKRNTPGAILIGALFAVMVPSTLSRWTNDASPVRSVNAVDATVKSAQFGKGRTVFYLLFLGDGSSVLVSDDRPFLVGSHVSVEQVTRDNGFVFYRFPE
jgi:hypothetical protein